MSSFTLGLLLLICASCSLAQNSQSDALNLHNQYRVKHRSPAMQLDSQLSAVAARCARWVADQGELDHNCPYKKGVGENLAWNSKTETSAVREAVKDWYDEVKFYNYDRPGFSMKTGHFTQVVWKASTKLGIGTYRDQRTGRTYVVAHYSPPGNMNTKAEFQKNVLKP